MSAVETTHAGVDRSKRIEPPPLPPEHGSWVMLYAPLLLALISNQIFVIGPALLIVMAATGLFLARNTTLLVMRGRRRPGIVFWLVIYYALFFTGAVPLFVYYRRINLLPIGFVAAALYWAHAKLYRPPSAKRLDRTIFGEFLGVAALTLTAPAARVAVIGRMDWTAGLLWISAILYFTSSIFTVKMMLSAAKHRDEIDRGARWRLGRNHLLYHVVLVMIIFSYGLTVGGTAGLFIVTAYLPLLIRAFSRWYTLSNRLPVLKRIGWMEAAYTAWFILFFTVGLLPHHVV